jgi:hypothetical protein
LQWSATFVTLVTWKTCGAPALDEELIVPEPETPAWPTLPVPVPVCALALAEFWSLGVIPGLLALAPLPGWPFTWICSPMCVLRSLASPVSV